ncbi:hypothetical protein HG536_0A04950 [Torulaspora globosa]|uniref:Uncharacterized protein n=1 Tax=Torulaspora globosa TaxID=48254 RepID=A0A7G3ZAZ4_9SACH|nr:uncharacterized protein HG536_0A04950 [Torulaspora globosa]QLL30680.1 hypothetical protein HG536_0A04950 [Torulaspora globosa]
MLRYMIITVASFVFLQVGQQTFEVMVVYEEAIEIPLVDDDEDDEEDDSVEEQDHGHNQEQDTVKEEDDDEEDEANLQVPEISRSATATPLSHRNTVDGEQDEDYEDEEVKSSERARKHARADQSKAPPGKKVPLHLLEKRRLGRIKAAEEFAKKLKQIGIEKVENTTLPATGLFQPVLLINQKNYSSDYLKKDEQMFALRERKTLRNNTQASSIGNTPDIADLKNGTAEPADMTVAAEEDIDLSDANKTLVIHPGSRTIKVGLAKNEVPLVVPSCVAIPKSESSFNTSEIPITADQPSEFEELKATIQQSFKERMRYYKRKVPYNAREQVLTFNRASKPQFIEDKNDPDPKEWINRADRRYYGVEATRCSKENFTVRYPFTKGGSFNVSSPYYASLQDLMHDVISLLEYALSSDGLSITRAQYSQYKVVLVVPDLFEKTHVEMFIRTLLTEMQFQAVAIIQESLATCYGAGQSSSTCVVNIGTTHTTIACIDEGSVLENSLISLNYGGDDITRLFALLLMQSEFPYKNWDLNSSHGWLCAQELKEKYITFQDANVTVQLYNYIKRIPGQPLEQYEFKVFDEVMVAPLALFYPEIIAYLHSKQSQESGNAKLEEQLPASRDIFTSNLNDWRSLSQNECLNGELYCGSNQDERMLSKLLDLQTNIEELQNEDLLEPDRRKNYTPLEKAIIQSITNASISLDVAKMMSFYSNILVVGGGSEIPALDFVLTDRISIWRPRLLSVSSFANFFKKLAKKAKDIRTAAKSANPEDEDKSPQKIKEMIKEELEEYWEGAEAQNGNEHLLPVNVLPPPRDMDPAVLTWKGASVLAQIKLVEELYLTSTDWDIHGSRILQYKCLFAY